MCLLDERSLILGLLLSLISGQTAEHIFFLQGFHLLAVVLIKGHIIVAYEVITLLTGALGRLTIAPLLPGKHRLTDVDTTIVHDIGLHHLVAIGLHNLCQRPA